MDENSRFDPEAEPRRQHYFFAHVALPSLFFKSPTDFVHLMGTAGIKFLENLWNRLTSEEIDEGPISSRGLKLDISKLMSDVECCVISLPTPRSVAEAHFVAAVHRPASSQNQVLE